MSEKARYMVVGAILALAIVVLVSAVSARGEGNGAGNYQVAAGSSYYVVYDTRTGKVIEMHGELTKPKATLADYVDGSIRPSGSIDIGNSGFGGFRVDSR